VLVKWLWGSGFKMLAHPSLLPIALATFISVAGPGGFAEIGRHVSAVPTVTVTPESPPIVPNTSAVLVRQVNDELPAVAEPPVEHIVATELEISDEPQFGPPAEAPVTHEVALAPTEVPEPTIQPVGTDTPTVPDVEPVVVPGTPEEPAGSPSDETPSEDGTGDAGDNDELPDGDGGPESPPDEGEDPGEGEPGEDDPGDGGDEVQCDPPGNGPHPHDGVPPGHDQNGDGIDDRCQDTESDGQDGGGEGNDTGTDGAGDNGSGDDPAGDNGTGDTDTGDTGSGDTGTGDSGAGDTGTSETGGDDEEDASGSGGDAAECDPPGNGHGNHGTPPPGHDTNEDGIDDRCQDFAGNPAESNRDDARKNRDDG
jgi:hypothetical protein